MLKMMLGGTFQRKHRFPYGQSLDVVYRYQCYSACGKANLCSAPFVFAALSVLSIPMSTLSSIITSSPISTLISIP